MHANPGLDVGQSLEWIHNMWSEDNWSEIILISWMGLFRDRNQAGGFPQSGDLFHTQAQVEDVPAPITLCKVRLDNIKGRLEQFQSLHNRWEWTINYWIITIKMVCSIWHIIHINRKRKGSRLNRWWAGWDESFKILGSRRWYLSRQVGVCMLFSVPF